MGGIRDADWEDIKREQEFDSRNSRVDHEVELGEIDWKGLIDGIILIAAGFSDTEGVSTVYLLAREAEEQQSLIEDGHFASAVIRQSTFFEYMLKRDIQNRFQEMVERDLFGSEQGFIEKLGHKNRVLLAHMLGLIDQRERDILMDMAEWRNTVAHEWWFVTERVNEKQLRDVAVTVNDLIWESIEEIVEQSDDETLVEFFEDMPGRS